MASEIVTGEMVLVALRAWGTGPGVMTGDAMRDALLAVAPLIRRAALEEAAGIHDAEAARAERDVPLMRTFDDRAHIDTIAMQHRAFATAIRALATQEPALTKESDDAVG